MVCLYRVVFMSLDKFEKLKNKTFSIAFEQDKLTQCELIEVKDNNSQTVEKGQSTPFSLVFETKGDLVYDQNTYMVSAEGLAETAIFLVPIGSDDKGMRYEAVFT